MKRESIFDKIVNVDWKIMFDGIKPMQGVIAECDDSEGVLDVILSIDGDMHLSLTPHPNGTGLMPGFRSRTWSGGGRNERTRIALLLLAHAIKDDKECEEFKY